MLQLALKLGHAERGIVVGLLLPSLKALGLGRSGRMCQLAASPPPPHHGAHQHRAHGDDKFIAVHPDASWPCLAVY